MLIWRLLSLRGNHSNVKVCLLRSRFSSNNAKKWQEELEILRNNNAKLTTALQESHANVEEWKRQLQFYRDECTRLRQLVSIVVVVIIGCPLRKSNRQLVYGTFIRLSWRYLTRICTLNERCSLHLGLQSSCISRWAKQWDERTEASPRECRSSLRRATTGKMKASRNLPSARDHSLENLTNGKSSPTFRGANQHTWGSTSRESI
jgi:hypothetical protein